MWTRFQPNGRSQKCGRALTTPCSRRRLPAERQLCSGSGHSRPQRELTVSATLRSSRRQRDRDADDRSQGSADVARRMRVARWFPERQLNRCRGHWASKTNRMSAAHGAGLTHPTLSGRAAGLSAAQARPPNALRSVSSAALNRKSLQLHAAVSLTMRAPHVALVTCPIENVLAFLLANGPHRAIEFLPVDATVVLRATDRPIRFPDERDPGRLRLQHLH